MKQTRKSVATEKSITHVGGGVGLEGCGGGCLWEGGKKVVSLGKSRK